jgi:hypothetical protein
MVLTPAQVVDNKRYYLSLGEYMQALEIAQHHMGNASFRLPDRVYEYEMRVAATNFGNERRGRPCPKRYSYFRESRLP